VCQLHALIKVTSWYLTETLERIGRWGPRERLHFSVISHRSAGEDGRCTIAVIAVAPNSAHSSTGSTESVNYALHQPYSVLEQVVVLYGVPPSI